jgi:hypothetical protein
VLPRWSLSRLCRRLPPGWLGTIISPGIWPLPDDLDVDLNQHPGPTWLDDLGARVRRRLHVDHRPLIVGHADWEAHNVLWVGGHLHVVHDLDSTAALSEAALAGAASAVYSATGAPMTEPTPAQSRLFLSAYEVSRGHPWRADELQILWVRAFNAKKAAQSEVDEMLLGQLAREADERLSLTGS